MATTPKLQIRSAYGPKARSSIIFPEGEGRTKQSFKDECDINQILARFRRTGVLEFTNKMQARYGDCTGADFRSAMDTVANAKSMFHAMPAHLRSRFDNDPAKFLDFVGDERNREEAMELGLLKEEPAPVPVEPAPAPADPAPAGGPGGTA